MLFFIVFGYFFLYLYITVYYNLQTMSTWKKVFQEYHLLISILILVILTTQDIHSQNCSVNANVDFSVCSNDSVRLNGAKGGLFKNDSSTIWIQVAGPSVIIANPYSLSTCILGYQPGNSYTFRLLSICEDNVVVFDDVIVTIKNASLANAGSDTTLCPGVYFMNANNVSNGEMGYWDIEGTNNGVIINSPNDPHTQIQLINTKSGSTTLKWTIINPNGCNTIDEVIISNKGGVDSVSAGPNRILTHCYNTSTNVILNGSYGGSGIDGQIGTWTTISGPSTPNIVSPNTANSTVSGLIEGAYTLQWSVTGTCVNNSSTMNIIVNPSSGPITTAGSGINPSNLVICDTSLRTILLNGPIPQYPNETTLWYQATSFPCTIQTPTNPTTTVSNLNGNSAYQFIYQITNSITGCSTSSLVRITYATPSSITITSPQNMTLPLDSTFGIVTYDFTGGNTTKYAIISTPSSTITNPQYINSASPQMINGLTEPGQYIIRFKRLTNGGVGSCFESYADVVINVSFSPHSSNAGTDQVLGCNVTSTTLVGNELDFEFGVWSQVSGPSTATIVNPNNNITLINNLTNGNYRFRWSVNGGVNSPTYYSEVSINVSLINPTQANAGSNITDVCYNTSITLNGNSPLNNETGVWSSIPDNSLTFTEINNPISQVFGLAESSSYKIIWSISNECGISSDTITLTTNATMGPISAIAGNDQCLPIGTEQIELQGNNAMNCMGEWSQASGANAVILTPNTSTTQVVGLQPGTYTFVWTLRLNNCSSKSDTVMITISSESQFINNTTALTQCSNTINLNGTTTMSGIGTWQQLTGPTIATFNNIHNNQNTLTNLTSGSYTFLWKIISGACTLVIDTIKYEIYTPPSPSNAGSDIVICAPDSIAHLNANIPINGIGFWSFISGPSTPIFSSYNNPNATISGLIMGTYILRWNIQGNANCPISYDDINISYSPLANAGPPIKLCNRSTVSLTGTLNSTGTWSLISGPNTPSIITISSNNAIVNNLIFGVYTFKYTINGSCNSNSTTTVTNYESPSLSNAGIDQSLCNMNTVQLDANTPSVGTATWTHSGPGAGTFSPNISSDSVNYSPLALGTHIFTWKITNGVCITSDYTVIRNYGAPTISNAGKDTIICGQTIRLDGNQPIVGIGEWSLINGPGTVIFSNPQSYNSQVTCSTPGIYKFKWNISSGNLACGLNNNYSEVTINFLATPPVIPNAGTDISFCDANEISVSANNVSPGIGFWTFQNGPNIPLIVDSLNSTTNISGLIPGEYTLLWNANLDACHAHDSLKITIFAPPSASITGDDIEICQYNTILLNGNQPSTGSGLWIQQSGPNNAIISHPTSNTTSVIGVIPGEYQFEWRISNGNCPQETSNIKIQVYENPTQSITGIPQQLCNQSVISLTGNTPIIGIGEWSIVNGPSTPTITQTSNNSAIATNITNGNYTFKWTIRNHICSSSSTINITNNPPPSISSYTSPSCNTGTITLVSNLTENQTFYLYSELGNLISSWTGIANSYTFHSIYTGSYYGKISHNLCNSGLSNIIQLNNLSNPTQPTNITVDRNYLCPTDNESITLNSGGGIGDSIVWYIENNQSPIYFGNSFTTSSPNATTTYYSANINSCGISNKDSIIIYIEDNQPPSATTNPTIILTDNGECEATNIVLTNPATIDNCGIASLNNNCTGTLNTGIHNILWTITDVNGNISQVTQQVTIISAPKSTPDYFTIENGFNSELLVLENDLDCDNNIKKSTLSILSNPIHGSTIINPSTVSILYTPDIYYVGFDTLTYQICDSTSLCSFNIAIINITQSNIPPQVSDSSFTTIENTPLDFCLPINDIYGPFPFTITNITCLNGTTNNSLNSNSACISYTPNLNYIGNDTIRVRVCDNGGLCDSALVIINIIPKTDLPKIALTQKATLINIDNNGNYLINYKIKVYNIGETNLININIIDSLSNTFNPPISYSITTMPYASGQLIVNSNFDGITNTNLLSSNSMLQKNSTDSISFDILVHPNGVFGTFFNYCYGFAMGLNGNTTTDLSDDGNIYDENNNGNPNEENENDPTPFDLISIPKFGIVQKLTATTQITENSYLIDLIFKVKNIGNDSIYHLDIQNDLTHCFLNSDFTVTKIYSYNQNIIVNPFFNGKQNTQILQNSDNQLSINDSLEISITILVNIDFGVRTYYNSATLNGTTRENTLLTDISDDEYVIDLNSNGITNEESENTPTPITIGEHEIWVPEGFSPNGDGENDYLIIKGNEYFTISIKIINRWGNSIYESADYQDDWNGKPNTGLLIDNSEVPEGTYFYIIDLNNKTKPIQGSITIKR